MRWFLLLVALMLSAACSSSPGAPSERDAGQQEMQRISERVRGLNGVTAVEAGYQDGFGQGGIVGVVATVRPGTPPEPLLDEIERWVWLSSLDPLGSISLILREEGLSLDEPGVGRAYPTEPDRAELERKYGPRPSS